MTLFKMKKENLITVAGIVWLLAGVNVALIGVRSAAEMSGATVGVVVALVVGAVAAFFRLPCNVRQDRPEECAEDPKLGCITPELPALLGPQGLPDHGLHDVLRHRAALKWTHPYLVLRILLHGTGVCSGSCRCQLPAAPGVWGRLDFSCAEGGGVVVVSHAVSSI